MDEGVPAQISMAATSYNSFMAPFVYSFQSQKVGHISSQNTNGAFRITINYCTRVFYFSVAVQAVNNFLYAFFKNYAFFAMTFDYDIRKEKLSDKMRNSDILKVNSGKKNTQ